MNFDGFSDTYDEAARLSILRLLVEQNDYRLLDTTIDDLLVTRYLVNRGIHYVHDQLNWLERSVGAVRVVRTSDVLYAVLTDKGDRHLMMREVIPGIRRPSAGGR